jgi:hypothetical protein
MCSIEEGPVEVYLDDDDFVGVADGGEAVRDDDGGAPGGEALEGGLHEALADGVQRAGGLVQQQDLGVLQQRPRNGDALLLAAAQQYAMLPYLDSTRNERQTMYLQANTLGHVHFSIICWLLAKSSEAIVSIVMHSRQRYRAVVDPAMLILFRYYSYFLLIMCEKP